MTLALDHDLHAVQGMPQFEPLLLNAPLAQLISCQHWYTHHIRSIAAVSLQSYYSTPTHLS